MNSTYCKIPFHWIHHESGCCGIEYDYETAHEMLYGGNLVEPATQEEVEKMVEEGYEFHAPYVFPEKIRAKGWHLAESLLSSFDSEVKGAFSNPGIPCEEAYSRLVAFKKGIIKQLEEIESLYSLSSQRIPDDLAEQQMMDEEAWLAWKNAI